MRSRLGDSVFRWEAGFHSRVQASHRRALISWKDKELCFVTTCDAKNCWRHSPVASGQRSAFGNSAAVRWVRRDDSDRSDRWRGALNVAN